MEVGNMCLPSRILELLEDGHHLVASVVEDPFTYFLQSRPPRNRLIQCQLEAITLMRTFWILSAATNSTGWLDLRKPGHGSCFSDVFFTHERVGAEMQFEAYPEDFAVA